MSFYRIEGRLPIPQKTKTEVLKRANGKCEKCHCKYHWSLGFSLHHLIYERDIYPYGKHTESVLGNERPEEMLWVCWTCQKSFHRGPSGQYYHDPQEAKAEWDYWDHIMSKD
jgi:hypothetical protein